MCASPASKTPVRGLDYGVDPAYLESMYERFQRDPSSVGESWRHFFAGMAFGQASKGAPGPQATPSARAGAGVSQRGGQALSGSGDQGTAHAQSNLASLIFAYRREGFLCADIDPLGEPVGQEQEHVLQSLQPAYWGFEGATLDEPRDAALIRVGPSQMTLNEILTLLRDTYTRSVGVEYMHIQDRGARDWLERQMESCHNAPALSHERKLEILEGLTDAEVFEKFTHTRYPGQKRFSLEGGETLIPGLQTVVEVAGAHGVKEIVLGMAHRGRLNVLANIMGMSYEMIFSEFEGVFLADSVQGDGDVKYHKGYSSQWQTRSGNEVHLSLTANPSHLEAVNPVVEGRARAKQRQHGDTATRRAVLPLLIHGDAAFAGQGIVAETLNLSQLDGYRTGGTVHIIINNQIGFTATPEEYRSTLHCTDTAKMVEAPILHVNGDDPEAMVYAMELALNFRQQFGRDVVVDMVCYRRHGHNEGDDPAFTQPVMYAKIKNRPSVRHRYIEKLVSNGELHQDQAAKMESDFRSRLEDAHANAKKQNVQIHVQAFDGLWEGMGGPFSFQSVDTGVSRENLLKVGRAISEIPEGFHLNPKVARQLPKRLSAVEEGTTVDWSLAEALSLGTLLAEGIPVRLSGQDSGRGTFSQRHAVWQDMQSAERYVPLNHIHPNQARFCVYNSSLSEASVLGFEYGYSLSEPRMLILWEAQFGDFVNGAQVIIDQFMTGAESKWQRDSGLVMLLPHGYEGQGPEHSNAYLERFLQGCAENNVQVCNLSTPAQYFHVLRRQMHRGIRLPLILMTPKSMLRHKAAVSPVAALIDGQFEEMIADPNPPRQTRRLVLCSGKIYWDLVEQREKSGVDDVAIIRIEQLYPLNHQKLDQVLQPHLAAKEVVWVQEEPQNRGAWTYIFPTMLETLGDRLVGYVGRAASASPATGSLKRHREEQQQLLTLALTDNLVTRAETLKAGDGNNESRRDSTGGRRVGWIRSLDRVV